MLVILLHYPRYSLPLYCFHEIIDEKRNQIVLQLTRFKAIFTDDYKVDSSGYITSNYAHMLDRARNLNSLYCN